jgi:DNA-binding transcriptional MocR family regulator
VPASRRFEIAVVARRYGLPIIEDDAYGFIPRPHGPAPFAALAPDLTWHIAGLAKCIGAGVRTAYVVAPDARRGWPFAAAVRAANVMASPFTVALATRWIEDGTADQVLRFIRAETAARQALASEILPIGSFRADRLSFNICAGLPAGWAARRSQAICARREPGSWRATRSRRVAIQAVHVCLAAPRTARRCVTRSSIWRTP